MSEVIYIPWSSAEEVNLLGWLSQHQHLSWDDKSNEYSDTFGHYRSPESLRGKQNQLMKGIRRQRVVPKRTLSELRHVAVRRTRRRRRRKFSDNLDSPPTSLGAPDPRERLQQQQDDSFCVIQVESAVPIVSDRITHRVFNEALGGFVSCILDIVSVIMIVRNWLSCLISKNLFEFVFRCFGICLQRGAD
ncbi:hypothetical protein CBS147330_9835 [Penicillium roqueforti]|nr:hypothetical protein CBS147330_9835 [Penicillium roqueforti]